MQELIGRGTLSHEFTYMAGNGGVFEKLKKDTLRYNTYEIFDQKMIP